MPNNRLANKVGYKGRLKPNSSFVERCNFCHSGFNQGRPTLHSEPKPSSKISSVSNPGKRFAKLDCQISMFLEQTSIML